MEAAYPYLSRNLPIERSAIYFDTEVPVFYETQAELAQTVVLWGPNLLQPGYILGVQIQLALRFGGYPYSYPYTPWENLSALIRLPPHLNRSYVVNELIPWCVQCNLLITAWTPELYLSRQPTFAYRIEVVITGFPLPLWSEFFIVRFLSKLGEILQVDRNNLEGHDKSCIVAMLRCIDLRTVPRFVNVHFLRFWAECRIHIRQWEDLPYVPPRFRPFPDFSDPDNPFGDDPSEADSLSPIRAHALACQDSMRQLFTASSSSSS